MRTDRVHLSFFSRVVEMKLDDLGVLLMVVSAVVVLGCLVFVFVMESQVAVPWLVLGHASAMVGAVGVKIGYVMRLEALAQRQQN